MDSEIIKEIEKAQEPIISELASTDYAVDNISSLLNDYKYLPENIIDILIKWAMLIKQPNVLNIIVRSIGGAQNRYDGKPLAKLFCECDNHSIRWAIANTFSISKPTNIHCWLSEALLNKQYGNSREMLCEAVANSLPYKDAIGLLQEVFRQMPAHSASALGKVGKEQEIVIFLESEYEEISSIIAQNDYSANCGYLPDNNIYIENHDIIRLTKEQIRKNYLKLSLKEISKAIKKIMKRVV